MFVFDCDRLNSTYGKQAQNKKICKTIISNVGQQVVQNCDPG